MKKYLAILLALSLILCTACGTDTPAPTPSAEPSAAPVVPDYGELYFASGSVKFGIFDEAEPVLSALGEPVNGTFESESCAYQGKDFFYYYDGFELMVNDVDGTLRITGITLSDDTVQTPQGLKIGMALDTALSLMPGAPEQNGQVCRFVSGSAALLLRDAGDGTLAAISYTAA